MVRDHKLPQVFHIFHHAPCIKADQTVFRLNVGGMGKIVQRTVREQFQHQRQIFRLRLVLLLQYPAQRKEGRDFVLAFSGIHTLHAAVKDTLFFRPDNIAVIRDPLIQGEDELGFIHNRVLISIAFYHIHSVQVNITSRTDRQAHAAQRLHQWFILPFRIVHKHLIF